MKRVCVFCGSSAGNRSVYAEAAQAIGRELLRMHIGLVYGGGCVGLMGIVVPFLDLTSGACLRSSNNYPHVLAAWLGTAELVDVSCSGARTTDMTSPQSTRAGAVRPQFNALSQDTDLVTLGIGGNDFGLFVSLTRICSTLADTDPTGDPCRRYFAAHGVDTKLRQAMRVGSHVGAVVAGIRERAPNARILVLGYPRIMPAQGGCPQRVLADGDARWANRVEITMNHSIRAAVTARGAHYIDLYRSTAGHSVCRGAESWISGPVTDFFRALAFHPYFTGMLNDAAELYRAITGRGPTPAQLAQARVRARQAAAVARTYATPRG